MAGSHTIVECGSSPIIVNISEWLSEFIGRYSYTGKIRKRK